MEINFCVKPEDYVRN
uniref:Uncharacterized protein n=1 Tax=Arundo donax TaxID=35708 RepID=A0A0A8ZLH3_ARUDO